MNIYESYTVVLALTEAQEALATARRALIKAEQSLPFDHPARLECQRMFHALYADTATVTGGDGLFWSIRHTIESVYK